MQAKYAKTGKFSVFLSYVQNVSPDAKNFLKKTAPSIPVYNQVRLPHAPCGRGIPHAVLFDHTGKVIGTGSHSQLLAKVEDLIKAAPEPPSPILGDVEVKYCKSQARQLASGRPIAPILKMLESTAQRKSLRTEEAKQLVAAVKSYVEKEQKRLKELAKSRPGKALVEIGNFGGQVRGMPCEDEMKAIYLELKKDPNVVALSQIRKKVDSIKDKIAKRGKSTRGDTKTLEKAKEMLTKMAGDSSASKAVVEEANELKDSF